MDSNNQNNPNSSNPIAGALTYPVSNEDNAQPVPEQPRQPRNLQGLLRFAMEATKAEDAPRNLDLGPMDSQRRTFLEDALRFLAVNVVQLVKNSIAVLTDTEKMHSIQLGDPLPDDVKAAFDNMMDFIDDIDVANDFYKMGGFAIFPVCYGSESGEVRARASAALGEVCQNNPACQARALEAGLLNVLLTLVRAERGDALVKCIYAISCATREYEPACRELVAQGGCDTLAALLAAAEPAARTKAAFLIRYLCSHHADAKEQFIKMNLIRIVADQLKSGRDQSSEHLLCILLVLLNSQDPTVVQQCGDPAINLKKIIEDHLEHPDLVDDTYREEKEYCQELLLLLQRCPVDLDDVADR